MQNRLVGKGDSLRDRLQQRFGIRPESGVQFFGAGCADVFPVRQPVEHAHRNPGTFSQLLLGQPQCFQIGFDVGFGAVAGGLLRMAQLLVQGNQVTGPDLVQIQMSNFGFNPLHQITVSLQRPRAQLSGGIVLEPSLGKCRKFDTAFGHKTVAHLLLEQGGLVLRFFFRPLFAHSFRRVPGYGALDLLAGGVVTVIAADLVCIASLANGCQIEEPPL